MSDHPATEQRRARAVRSRFWVEVGLGTLFAFLLALTLVTREWIEEIFGVDPDGGSGALEWLIVVGLGIAAAIAFGLARYEWRVVRPAQAG
jgi:hypothetical protein